MFVFEKKSTILFKNITVCKYVRYLKKKYNLYILFFLEVVNQRLGRVQQDLNRLHRESRDNQDTRIRDVLKERIAALTSAYLTLRAAMLPQANDIAVTHLLAATSHWLVQVCVLLPQSHNSAVAHLLAATSHWLVQVCVMLPQAHNSAVTHLLAAISHWLVQVCVMLPQAHKSAIAHMLAATSHRVVQDVTGVTFIKCQCQPVMETLKKLRCWKTSSSLLILHEMK